MRVSSLVAFIGRPRESKKAYQREEGHDFVCSRTGEVFRSRYGGKCGTVVVGELLSVRGARAVLDAIKPEDMSRIRNIKEASDHCWNPNNLAVPLYSLGCPLSSG